MDVGAPELLIVLVVVLLLFGGSKLPQLARSIGAAKGEFERGVKDGEAKARGKASTSDEAPAADDASA